MRTQKFAGPVDQDYLKSDVFGVESTVWSPCGAEGMLNINSAVQITPLDSTKPAFLTVRTVSHSGMEAWPCYRWLTGRFHLEYSPTRRILSSRRSTTCSGGSAPSRLGQLK